jgi:hypothetical protein
MIHLSHHFRPIPSNRFSFFVLITFLLSSCIQTQAYPGPALERHEVSRVYFYSNKGMQTRLLSIDGKEQGLFNTGIEILPGDHTFHVSYEISSEDCYGFDYCFEAITIGACNGKLTTQAGGEYRIQLTGSTAGVSAVVTDEDSGVGVGYGTCENSGTRSGRRTTPY